MSWNPTACFSVGVWGFWQQDSAGFRTFGNQGVVHPSWKLLERAIYTKLVLDLTSGLPITSRFRAKLSVAIRTTSAVSKERLPTAGADRWEYLRLLQRSNRRADISPDLNCASSPPTRSGPTRSEAPLHPLGKVAIPGDSRPPRIPTPSPTMVGCLVPKWNGSSEATLARVGRNSPASVGLQIPSLTRRG